MTARGLFLSFRPFLDGPSGGVQVCTREYLQVIRAAGVDLTILPFDSDRRLSTRLLRRVNSSPYERPFDRSLIGKVVEQANLLQPDFVFLNQGSLSAIASEIRPALPAQCKIVVLSHGMEITDLMHYLRLRKRLPLSGRARPTAAWLLGSVLTAEAASRRDIDLVCTLSPFDAAMEAWLGVRRATWLPRIVAPELLAWRPMDSRLGYVGTLDHGPNLEGLVATLDALSGNQKALEIRVVGGPPAIGKWLARRYPFVTFLGGLADSELAMEAATWNAFLHPIFCAARGCSTKLALAIGWGIPIVTTPQGRRGYTWSGGSLVEASNPSDFASRCREMFDPAVAAAAQVEVAKVAASSPSLLQVASDMREFLGLPGAAMVSSHLDQMD